ncbi:MAG: hypothetical protein PUE30_09565 [Spirochaetia bacterium]|nr:hypothetical protein [Spirochaetia bacterium]
MQKIRNKFLAVVLVGLFFTGCDVLNIDLNFSSSGSSSESEETENAYETVTAYETVDWDASKSEIFEVSPSVKTVNVRNLPSKKQLLFVKRNTGTTVISKSKTRIVENASNSSASSRAAVFEQADGAEELFEGKNFLSGGVSETGCWIPPEYDFEKEAASAGRSATDSVSSEKVSGKVGEPRSLFVDTEYTMTLSNFEQKPATLRAAGTYCYVWVLDDYYAEKAEEDRVNSAIAEKYAQAFDTMYPMIRNVFGEESDKLYVENYLMDMSSYSPTGTKVNIVIYDIGADYNNAEEYQTGVVGYFYSKDYGLNSGTIYPKSNSGKYFYVDSGYINKSFDQTVSTLAHEFQHMIGFNQKYILNGKNSETWYSEMLSMLCEDLMQEHLGIEDGNSPKGRTQTFNALYFYSGISEYNESNPTVSYATAYSFGSFLARNFGGAALVQKISTNSSVNEDSILNAVNSLNGTSYTWDYLFEKYLLALTGNSSFTHNRDAACTLSYTYEPYSEDSPYRYPMKAYDIYSDDWAFDISVYSSALSGTCNGPYVFTKSQKLDLRPDNGISIHSIGRNNSSSAIDVTVDFSSSGPENEIIYLVFKDLE